MALLLPETLLGTAAPTFLEQTHRSFQPVAGKVSYNSIVFAFMLANSVQYSLTKHPSVIFQWKLKPHNETFWNVKWLG